ncbi:UNVERIFIED_CONTAM: hypothetical protein GTU68_017526, partial [Idotea baltica]|nr:hypothetical protein [Idotea baltica]
IIEVDLSDESRTRYLTYALSVVSSRALPDVRDGFKPVQRRILYAMLKDLRLGPDKHFRKSAAVVGEVLARYHPHGDSACYEAMVRMAQDFSLRYPLVHGQGNFGSLDGDSAAAYRYTEAKLRPIAVEAIGDIGQETVAERDNFDQTVKEPVVLPSRIPNLLMNGAAGIAVGMATAIPPHNLRDLVSALLLLIEEPDTANKKLVSKVKGPDFPTACLILNSKEELEDIYSTGRGPIRMRGVHVVEKIKRGKVSKPAVVISAIPYNVDKAQLVEKIADLIIARKVPQLVDVRDESTDIVRIVLELADRADAEKAMAYLFKHTPLQQNFNVNLTALVPTENPMVGRPTLLSLKEMLQHFIDFRIEVTRCKLLFEKNKLDERLHLLEGLLCVIDVLDEVIAIVRKSDGRSDAAQKLQKRFKLSELQAFFIVDLRIYQLSRTNVDEVQDELNEKLKRVRAIEKILKSKKLLRAEVSRDLNRVVEEYGDPRKSVIEHKFQELQVDEASYIEHEQVHVVITSDGWTKRIRNTNDPQTTRLREGDSIFFTREVSTADTLLLFTSAGNVFGVQVLNIISTNGYGEPVQKLFQFGDGEQIVAALLQGAGGDVGQAELFKNREMLFYTEKGYGFRYDIAGLGVTTRKGKRVARLGKEDVLSGVIDVPQKLVLAVSSQGYGSLFIKDEITILSGAGRGVQLVKLPNDDSLVAVASCAKKDVVKLEVEGGKPRDVECKALTIGSRAKRGNKVVKRGGPVIGQVH